MLRLNTEAFYGRIIYEHMLAYPDDQFVTLREVQRDLDLSDRDMRAGLRWLDRYHLLDFRYREETP